MLWVGRPRKGEAGTFSGWEFQDQMQALPGHGTLYRVLGFQGFKRVVFCGQALGWDST